MNNYCLSVFLMHLGRSRAKFGCSAPKQDFLHALLRRWPLISTALLWFNRGHEGFEEVLQKLGVFPPLELIALSNQRDQKTIKKSVKKTAEDNYSRQSQCSQETLPGGESLQGF